MQSNAGGTESHSDLQKQQQERLRLLPELVNKQEPLVRRGRFVTLDFQIVVDDEACLVSIEQGKVAHVQFGTQPMRSCAFIVRAPAEAWEKFWQQTPDPWSQDLFAMVKKGRARIDGNLHPFIANLQYFKDIIAAPRAISPTSH